VEFGIEGNLELKVYLSVHREGLGCFNEAPQGIQVPDHPVFLFEDPDAKFQAWIATPAFDIQ